MSAKEFSASDFPALRDFLRGYMHQDMALEYRTPENAARQFCKDASDNQRAAVATEWATLVSSAHGQPLERLNHILTGPLGGAILLTEEDVSAISRVFTDGV